MNGLAETKSETDMVGKLIERLWLTENRAEQDWDRGRPGDLVCCCIEQPEEGS